MNLALSIELSVFGLLMGLSAFFSSSETSLFSLNRLQIEQMRRNDNPRVDLIERLLSEPRRLIITILIGNEFVNVAASVTSAAIIIEWFGAENKLVNVLVMVPALLLLGEITPKTLAIRNNVLFATFQSRPIELFAVAIAPLRSAVRLAADWLTTLMVGRERTPGSIVTEDMVRVLAHEAVGEGVLDEREAKYVDRVFDFGHKRVGDLRTPRSHILFLPVEMSLREIVAELRRTRHTKVPVYEGHRDNVIGFLYARDLLGIDAHMLDTELQDVVPLLREAYFVSESQKANVLFHTFRKRKLSVALTIDEYGGVTGLVTMEDVLESIFGELPSPSDEASPPQCEKRPDGTVRIDGTMRVRQFNRQFQSQLDAGRAATVGGLLLSEYGEIPTPGVRIALGEFVFEIVEVQANRIHLIAVRRSQDSTTALPLREEGGSQQTRSVGRRPDDTETPSDNPDEHGSL